MSCERRSSVIANTKTTEERRSANRNSSINNDFEVDRSFKYLYLCVIDLQLGAIQLGVSSLLCRDRDVVVVAKCCWF